MERTSSNTPASGRAERLGTCVTIALGIGYRRHLQTSEYPHLLPAQALMAGETVAGLAGGVNAMMLPITTCTICGLSALSPEARCKTFDASADGYGRGEGFAGASIQFIHRNGSFLSIVIIPLALRCA